MWFEIKRKKFARYLRKSFFIYKEYYINENNNIILIENNINRGFHVYYY